MPNPAPCWLLPRICETITLRRECLCLPLRLDCPLPEDACFISGSQSAAPTLQHLQLQSVRDRCFCKLDAELHLPVCLHFICGCEHISRSGCMTLPIQAQLRTQTAQALQYIPQTELCIRKVFTQDGCICAEIDVRMCLYAVQLQAVRLDLPCPEPQRDCAPYFHLPLYPELPPRKR